MKFKNYLGERYQTRNLMSDINPDLISKKKLKAGDRKKVNTQIQKLLKPTYFKDIPLDGLFSILEKNGLIAIQEDNTRWSGLLLGGSDRTEMVHFNLGWKNESTKIHGMDVFMAVPNAVLTMTYYKMQSGKFEVIAYVS
jgi:hypothetical protein